MIDQVLRDQVLLTLSAVVDEDGWAYAWEVGEGIGIGAHRVAMVLMWAERDGLVESELGGESTFKVWGLSERGAQHVTALEQGDEPA